MININLLNGLKDLKYDPNREIASPSSELENLVKELKKFNFDKPFYTRTWLEENYVGPIMTVDPVEPIEIRLTDSDKIKREKTDNIKKYIVKSHLDMPLRNGNEWVVHIFNKPDLANIALECIDNPISDENYKFILKDMESYGKVVKIPSKKTYSIHREIKLQIPHLSNLSKLEQGAFMKQFLLSLNDKGDCNNNIIDYEKESIMGFEFLFGLNSKGSIVSIGLEKFNDRKNGFKNNIYVDNEFYLDINSDGANLFLKYSSPEYKLIDLIRCYEGPMNENFNLILKKFDWSMKRSKNYNEFLSNLSRNFNNENYNIRFVNPYKIFLTDYRAKLIKDKESGSDNYKNKVNIIKKFAKK